MAVCSFPGRALAPSKEERYTTAREMQADLEAFIRDEQLAVSPLSLGEWMQSLFDEKLAQQKQMLQEGRQLAEVLAAQAPQSADDLTLGGHSLSGVSVIREKSKTPWMLLALVLLLAAGAGVAAWQLWPEGPPTGMTQQKKARSRARPPATKVHTSATKSSELLLGKASQPRGKRICIAFVE